MMPRGRRPVNSAGEARPARKVGKGRVSLYNVGVDSKGEAAA